MTKIVNRTHTTPPVLADEIGCNVSSILTWIHSGELKAVNVGHARRPRWRISRADWQTFLDSRSNQAQPDETPRNRPAAKPRKQHV
jgi:hypothetical protein